MEGVRKGMWQFADPAAGNAVLKDYIQRMAAIDSDMAFVTAPASPVEPMPGNAVRASAQEAQVPSREKKSIIEDIADLLSFGDEKVNPPASIGQPTYPPVPVPPRKPGY